MKTNSSIRVSWKLVVLFAGVSLLNIPAVFADDPAEPRGSLDDATVFYPPYSNCQSWGASGCIGEEAHDCSAASGAIGVYAAGFGGAGTSEATQQISLSTGRRKVVTVDAAITLMHAAGSVVAGWGGTYTTWHLDSLPDDHKETLDAWINWEIVATKLLGLLVDLGVPVAPDADAEALVENAHLILAAQELLNELDKMKASGHAATRHVTFSFTAEPNESHELQVGVRASALGLWLGSAYALAFGQVESITVHGIAPPDTPYVDAPPWGYAGAPYDFSATASDVNDDDVKYEFDWGDGTPDTYSA
ncbi:MAG TPA: hypothetical protein VMV94_20095, partial [Phycisphaerae bacterium]|nr:hypothetical protein [Phycisphaerae bacterium]